MANLNAQPTPITLHADSPLADRRIRVLLVNAHTLVHLGIAGMLKACADIELVGAAMSEQDIQTMCTHLNPDVILLDLLMLELNGMSMIRQIARQISQVHIIALAAQDNDKQVGDILRAGAHSYLCKDVTAQELATAIRATVYDRVILAPEAVRALIHSDNQPSFTSLTTREHETLTLLAQGFSNRQIAQKHSVSPYTVKNHVRNILQKLHAANRAEAAILAVKHQLVAIK